MASIHRSLFVLILECLALSLLVSLIGAEITSAPTALETSKPIISALTDCGNVGTYFCNIGPCYTGYDRSIGCCSISKCATKVKFASKTSQNFSSTSVVASSYSTDTSTISTATGEVIPVAGPVFPTAEAAIIACSIVGAIFLVVIVFYILRSWRKRERDRLEHIRSETRWNRVRQLGLRRSNRASTARTSVSTGPRRLSKPPSYHGRSMASTTDAMDPVPSRRFQPNHRRSDSVYELSDYPARQSRIPRRPPMASASHNPSHYVGTRFAGEVSPLMNSYNDDRVSIGEPFAGFNEPVNMLSPDHVKPRLPRIHEHRFPSPAPTSASESAAAYVGPETSLAEGYIASSEKTV